MAQKLTEQEHDAIVSLAKLLSKELPVQQRSVSGGIASGLVRLRKNPLGREDVMGVLTKYGAGEPTLKDLLDLHVLEREKGRRGLCSSCRRHADTRPGQAREQQGREERAIGGAAGKPATGHSPRGATQAARTTSRPQPCGA